MHGHIIKSNGARLATYIKTNIIKINSSTTDGRPTLLSKITFAQATIIN